MADLGSRHVANTASALQDAILQHVRYSLGKGWQNLSGRDLFMATALAARDRLVDGMLETEERYQKEDAKRLYYLSIEFLMGRSLENNLCNLGILERCQEALRQIGVDWTEVEESESDAALGNGGLGRLACVAKKLKRPFFPSIIASPHLGLPLLISSPRRLIVS